MSPRTKARLAVVVGCLALLLLATNATLIWLIDVEASMGSPPAAMMWLVGLAGAPVVGMMIASRRPDHMYGWLLLSFGVVSALLEITELGALYALERDGSAHPVGVVGALASQTLWGATIGHLPLLLLLFPDGRLPSPRWRWLGRWIVGLTVSGGIAALFIPGELGVVPLQNPIGATGMVGTIMNVVIAAATVGVFLSMFPAAASLFVRQRRGTPQERLQLRWFSYAAAMLAVALVVSGFASFANEIVSNAIFMVALCGVFGAIGVAVSRYRLYDIDRVVSRTVSYGALTILVVGVYLLSVTSLTTLTSSVTGESTPAVAAATLAAAAVVGPARRKIQSGVDRRFNRSRYDAALAVDEYRSRLRDAIDIDAVTTDLLTTVQATMEPVDARLWLRRSQDVTP